MTSQFTGAGFMAKNVLMRSKKNKAQVVHDGNRHEQVFEPLAEADHRDAATWLVLDIVASGQDHHKLAAEP